MHYRNVKLFHGWWIQDELNLLLLKNELTVIVRQTTPCPRLHL